MTFSFGDPSAGLHGLARLGLSEEGASALAVLFDGREPVTVDADVDGLATTEEEPGRRWTLREHLDGALRQQWRSMVRDPAKRVWRRYGKPVPKR